MNDDKMKNNQVNNEQGDNIYENFTKKTNEAQVNEIPNSNNSNINEPYHYVEKEHNDNYLETHTVVTKASKVSRIVLVGFYSLFIVVGVLVFLMLRADRYEFYLVKDEVKINSQSTYQVELTPKNVRYFDYLNYKYETSDPSIATVDEFGTITTVGTGETTLTISMKPFISKTMKIIAEKIVVQNITLKVYKNKKLQTGTTINLQPSQTITLKALINNRDDLDSTVEYSSSNTKVATVDSNGNVTTKGEGTAVISGTREGVSGTITVVVKKTTPKPAPQVINTKITKVDIGTNQVTKYVGESFSLTPTITPDTETPKSITWTSSNTKVATVSQSGVVKTVKKGTAVITVNADGIKDTCTVIVKEQGSTTPTPTPTPNTTVPSGTQFSVGQVKLSKTSLTISKGGSSKFSITVTGAAGVIVVSSSNAGVAKVSSTSSDCNGTRCFFDAQEGKSASVEFTVTGVASGTAYINATLEADNFFKYDLTSLSGTGKIGVLVK